MRVARLFRAAPRRRRVSADVRAAVLSQLRGKVPAISAELAERLIGIAPAGMGKVLFANSGSEANDAAIKLAWYVNNAVGRPQKKKIISRKRAYHGVTIASREPDRTRLRARRFRSADRSHPARRMPVPLPRRAAGRERGSVRARGSPATSSS